MRNSYRKFIYSKKIYLPNTQIPAFTEPACVCLYFPFILHLRFVWENPKFKIILIFIEPSFLCLMLYICYLSHSIYCLVIPFLQ